MKIKNFTDFYNTVYRNRTLLFIILLGILIRFVVFFVYKPWNDEVVKQIVLVAGDAPNYHKLALNILETGNYPENTFLSAKITPFYPYFIAFIYSCFGIKPWVVIFFQIILNLLSLIVIFKICSIFFDRQMAVLTTFIYAIDPHSIIHSQTLMADTFFVVIFLFSVYLFIVSVKKNKIYLLLLCGFLLGIATLTKPVLQFFPFLVLPVVTAVINFGWKKNLKQVLFYLIGFILTISPWIYRNYHLYGKVGLSTVTGYNLLFFNIAKLQEEVNNISFTEAQKKLKEVAELRGSGQLTNPFEKETLYKEIAVEYIKKNIFTYISVHIKGFVYMYFTPASSVLSQIIKHKYIRIDDYINLSRNSSFFQSIKVFFNVRSTPEVILAFSILIFYFIIYILFITSFFSICKNKEYAFIVICLMIIIYFTIITGPVGHARYRLPINPFLIIISSKGIFDIYQFYKRKFKSISSQIEK